MPLSKVQLTQNESVRSMAICCCTVPATIGCGHEQSLEANIGDNELKTEHVFSSKSSVYLWLPKKTALMFQLKWDVRK